MDDSVSLCQSERRAGAKIPSFLPYFAQVLYNKKGRANEVQIRLRKSLLFLRFNGVVGGCFFSWLKVSPTPPPLELIPCSV